MKSNLLFDVALIPNWELEASISDRWPVAGEYMLLHYHVTDNYQTLLWQNNGKYTWLGYTKAKIPLVWTLDRKLKKQKGGGQLEKRNAKDGWLSDGAFLYLLPDNNVVCILVYNGETSAEFSLNNKDREWVSGELMVYTLVLP